MISRAYYVPKFFAFAAIAFGSLDICTVQAHDQSDAFRTQAQKYETRFKSVHSLAAVEKLGWESVMAKNVLESLKQYQAKVPLTLVYDPKRQKLTFKLIRDGNELLSVEEGNRTIFCARNDAIFFLHYTPRMPGIYVLAFDLGTGKELWRAKLQALGNKDSDVLSVGMAISLTDDSLLILGHETAGSFVEAIDEKSGRTLANKELAKKVQ